MKFGVAVTTSVTPAVTAEAQADYVRRLAPAVDDAGYDSIWVSDRTVFPFDLADRYPDMFGPGHSNPDAQNVLEALTTLSYIAGATKNARLGISVLVLPFRNAILNAKMITTLDVLSGGRAIFGVGLGWMPEEFASMGASHPDRGAVTDEHIEIYKALCTQDVAEYHGKHVQTSGMVFFPKPSQKPNPPVWIGGNSRAALRRTAKLGDAWHGIRMPPNELAEKRKTLRRLCEENGRDPNKVAITLRATLQLDAAQLDESGNRVMLTGKAQEVIDDLKSYEEAGLEYMVLSVAARDTESTIDSIKRFAEDVQPRFQ